MRPILERLRPDHITTEFDCGDAEMNLWLRERALSFQESRFSAVHVLVDPSLKVLGFFTLNSFSVHLLKLDLASQRQYQEFQCNVPAFLIGKLARDRSVRGRKVGEYILELALRKSLEIANSGIGCALVVVEANESRIPWYQDLMFTRASATSKLLYIPISDVELQAKDSMAGESCFAGIGNQEKDVL